MGTKELKFVPSFMHCRKFPDLCARNMKECDRNLLGNNIQVSL